MRGVAVDLVAKRPGARVIGTLSGSERVTAFQALGLDVALD